VTDDDTKRANTPEDKSDDTPDSKAPRRVGPRFEKAVRDRLKSEGWTPPDEDTRATQADDEPPTANEPDAKPRAGGWPTVRAVWGLPIRVVSYAIPILLTIFLLKTFGGLAMRWADVPTDVRETAMRVIGAVTRGSRSTVVEKYQATLVGEPTRELPELVIEVTRYREEVQTLADRVELTRLRDDRAPAADERLTVSIGGREVRGGVVTGENGRATIDLAPALARGGYDKDATLAVTVGVPAADYQRSYRYKLADLMRPYYAFGAASHSPSQGGEPDGVTAADLAYEVVEAADDDSYRISLADGSQRWVTSTEARWTGFQTTGGPRVISLASLEGVERPQQVAVEAAVSPPTLGVGVTRALLVGVDRYEHHADLANPVYDVEAIERELRDVYKARVTTLRNPTRRDFLMALYGQADEDYGRNDQLLVYFAGHGWFDERLRRGFLALTDSEPLADDPLRDTLVSHEDVRTILERLDCEHVLLMLDSCFSGTVDPTLAMATTRAFSGESGFGSTAEYLERKLAYRTRRYITAGGNEYVPDGRPGHHSPFSRQFLEALRTYGGSDGVLTLEEILVHLERVDPQPKAGELTGNEPGSSFVFVARPISPDQPAEPGAEYGTLAVNIAPAHALPTLERIERVDNAARLPAGGEAHVGGATHRFYVRVGAYRVHVTVDGASTVAGDVVIASGEQAITVETTPAADGT
jgi:hypothetical protein